MQRLRLLQFERVALVMLLFLLGGLFLLDLVYAKLWLAGLLVLGFLWMLAAIFAVCGVVFACTDRSAPVERLRTAAAMPLAMAAAFVLASPALDAGRWLLGYAHLRWHESEYQRQILGRPADPIAFRYLEGVPDGGVSIVHSVRDPETLTPSDAIRLLGEPIRRCRWLRNNYYLCSHG